MKVLLMSIGSRGDCEPFLGVAEMLRSKGETVICAFPEQYRSLACESGFEFHSLGADFLKLLDGYVGRAAMSAGVGVKKIRALIKLTKQSLPIQKELIALQRDIVETTSPDMIVFHPKAVYPVPWSLSTGKKAALLIPVPYVLHRVNDVPHIGIGGKIPIGLSYALAQMGNVQSVMSAVKLCYNGKFTQKRIKEAILSAPCFYTVSPQLFRRPEYWGSNIMVAGFWERDKTLRWTPPPELSRFVDSHKKIMFVTFGSMTNLDPAGITKTLLDAVETLGVSAIFNISGGGLEAPERYDREKVLFTSSVPYDWVFPKVYAVVCHGGAGTVHTALKYGCAVTVLPHVGDQMMWADLLVKKGAGPKGVQVSKLNRQNAGGIISELMDNASFKNNALAIGAKMREENYQDELYNFLMEE